MANEYAKKVRRGYGSWASVPSDLQQGAMMGRFQSANQDILFGHLSQADLWHRDRIEARSVFGSLAKYGQQHEQITKDFLDQESEQIERVRQFKNTWGARPMADPAASFRAPQANNASIYMSDRSPMNVQPGPEEYHIDKLQQFLKKKHGVETEPVTVPIRAPDPITGHMSEVQRQALRFTVEGKKTSYSYDIFQDPYTGAIAYGSSQNRSGVFMLTGDITQDAAGGFTTPRSNMEVLGAGLAEAKKSGQSLAKVFSPIISGGDIEGKNKNGTWLSWQEMNSPTLNAYSKALKMRFEGGGNIYASQKQSFITAARNVTGENYYSRGGSSFMLSLDNTLSAVTAGRYREGVLERFAAKVKRFGSTSGTGSFTDLSFGPGFNMEQQQAPWRLAGERGAGIGESQAMRGFRVLSEYSLLGMEHSAGQALTKRFMGAKWFDVDINVDPERGPQLSAGQYFANNRGAISNVSDQFTYGGSTRQLQTLMGRKPLSGVAQAIEGVEWEPGSKTARVKGYSYQNRLSWKLRGKNAMFMVGNERLPMVNYGGNMMRADISAALPGPADMPLLAQNILAGEYANNPEGFKNWFMSTAENMYQEYQSGVGGARGEALAGIFKNAVFTDQESYEGENNISVQAGSRNQFVNPESRARYFESLYNNGEISPGTGQELLAQGAMDFMMSRAQFVNKGNMSVSRMNTENMMRARLESVGVTTAEMSFKDVYKKFTSDTKVGRAARTLILGDESRSIYENIQMINKSGRATNRLDQATSFRMTGVNDISIVGTELSKPRPEYERDRHTLKPETLQMMSQSNPALYESLMRQKEAGIWRTDHTALMQGMLLAGMTPEDRTRQVAAGKANIVDFSHEDWSQAQSGLNPQELTPNQFAQQSLARYGSLLNQRYGYNNGEIAVRIPGENGSEYIMPSPSALAKQMYQSNDPEKGVGGIAVTAGNTLQAVADSQMMAESGITSYQDAAAQIAASAHAGLYGERGVLTELAKNKNLINSAAGIELRRMGGQAMGVQGLAPNEVVVSLRHTMKMMMQEAGIGHLNQKEKLQYAKALKQSLLMMSGYTNYKGAMRELRKAGVTNAEAIQLVKDARGKTMTITGERYPLSAPGNAFLSARQLYHEMERKINPEMWRGIANPGNNVYVSSEYEAGSKGDFDFDRLFHEESYMPRGGKWIGENVPIQSAAEIEEIGRQAMGSEYEANLKSAIERKSLRDYAEEGQIAANKGWKTVEQIGSESLEEESIAKSNAGPAYNQLIRGAYRAGMQYTKGLEAQGLAKSGLSMVAEMTTQMAIDRDNTKNVAIRNIIEIMQSGRLGRGGSGGALTLWTPSGGAVAGGTEESGRHILQQYFDVIKSGIEGELSNSDAAKYARTIGGAILPANMLSKENVAAVEGIMQGYRSGDISNPVDQFLATTKTSATEWLLGKYGEEGRGSLAPGNVHPLGSMTDKGRMKDKERVRALPTEGQIAQAYELYQHGKEFTENAKSGNMVGMLTSFARGAMGDFGQRMVNFFTAGSVPIRDAASMEPIPPEGVISEQDQFMMTRTGAVSGGNPPNLPPEAAVPAGAIGGTGSGGNYDTRQYEHVVYALHRSAQSVQPGDPLGRDKIEAIARAHNLSPEQVMDIGTRAGLTFTPSGPTSAGYILGGRTQFNAAVAQLSPEVVGGGNAPVGKTSGFAPKALSRDDLAKMQHAMGVLENYQGAIQGGTQVAYSQAEVHKAYNTIFKGMRNVRALTESNMNLALEEGDPKLLEDIQQFVGENQFNWGQMQASGIFGPEFGKEGLNLGTKARGAIGKSMYQSVRESIKVTGMATAHEMGGKMGSMNEVIAGMGQLQERFHALAQELPGLTEVSKEQAIIIKNFSAMQKGITKVVDKLSEISGLTPSELEQMGREAGGQRKLVARLTGRDEADVLGMDDTEYAKLIGESGQAETATMFNRVFGRGRGQRESLYETMGGIGGTMDDQLSRMKAGELGVSRTISERAFRGVVGGYYAASAGRHIVQQTIGDSLQDMYKAASFQDILSFANMGQRGSIQRMSNIRASQELFSGLAAEEMYSPLMNRMTGMEAARIQTGAKFSMGAFGSGTMMAAGLTQAGYAGMGQAAFGIGTGIAVGGMAATIGAAVANRFNFEGYNQWNASSITERAAQSFLKQNPMGLSTVASLIPGYSNWLNNTGIADREKDKYAKQMGITVDQLAEIQRQGLNPELVSQSIKRMTGTFGSNPNMVGIVSNMAQTSVSMFGNETQYQDMLMQSAQLMSPNDVANQFTQMQNIRQPTRGLTAQQMNQMAVTQQFTRGQVMPGLAQFTGEQFANQSVNEYLASIGKTDVNALGFDERRQMSQVFNLTQRQAYYGQRSDQSLNAYLLAGLAPVKQDIMSQLRESDLAYGVSTNSMYNRGLLDQISTTAARRYTGVYQQGLRYGINSTESMLNAAGISARGEDFQAEQFSAMRGQMASLGYTGSAIDRRLTNVVGRDISMGTGLRQSNAFMGYVSNLESWGISPNNAPGLAEDWSQRYYGTQQQQRIGSFGGQFAGMGINADAVARMASQMANLNNYQASIAQGVLGGDAWKWSVAYNKGSNIPGLNVSGSGFRPLYDTKTGLGVFQQEQWQMQLQQYGMQFQGANGEQLRDAQGNRLSYGQMRSEQQFAIQHAMNFGGSYINPITGQQVSVPYGKIDIDRAQFQLGVQQQRQGFALEERQFGVTNIRQAREMDISQYQANRQYQWQVEDWTRGESLNRLQFGWQMQDFDENLRFSRGRERMQMLRQRDRSVVTESIRREGSQAQRERMDEQKQWQNEQFQRNREYFEQDKQFQRERMDLDRKFFEERTRWAEIERDLAIQQQILQDQMSQQDLQRAHEQAIIQDKIWQRQFEINQLTETWQAAIRAALEQWITSSNQIAGTNLQGPQPQSTSSGSVTQNLQNFYNSKAVPSSNIKSTGTKIFNAMSNIMGGLKGFAEGGPTGPGFKYEVKGMVHANEHVVPENGSLVIRGDNSETVKLLQEQNAILKQMLNKLQMKLVINTNDTRGSYDLANDLASTRSGIIG